MIILLLESPCSLVGWSVTKFQQNFSAQYLGNEKSYRRSAGVKTTGFSRAFWIFQKIWNFGFLDFWIFGFLDFWIFLDFRLYLGNENSYRKSAGVKTTGFSRAFWSFQKIWNFGFLNFLNFGYPDFLDFWRYLGNKKGASVKMTGFKIQTLVVWKSHMVVQIPWNQLANCWHCAKLFENKWCLK